MRTHLRKIRYTKIQIYYKQAKSKRKIWPQNIAVSPLKHIFARNDLRPE